MKQVRGGARVSTILIMLTCRLEAFAWRTAKCLCFINSRRASHANSHVPVAPLEQTEPISFKRMPREDGQMMRARASVTSVSRPSKFYRSFAAQRLVAPEPTTTVHVGGRVAAAPGGQPAATRSLSVARLHFLHLPRFPPSLLAVRT